MLTETKLDDSFPEGQFLMEEYHTPLSLTESKMGVVLLYIPEDIPAELLCSDFLIEIVYIEINLHNKKRLINYFYNLHNDNTLRQNYSSRGF